MQMVYFKKFKNVPTSPWGIILHFQTPTKRKLVKKTIHCYKMLCTKPRYNKLPINGVKKVAPKYNNGKLCYGIEDFFDCKIH